MLENRQDFVGSSDAPSLFGKGYKSLWRLWMEKRGLLEPENLDELEHIKWGKRLEDAIAKGYAEDNGFELITAQTFFGHPEVKGMGCTPDYFIIDDGVGRAILEVKNVDFFQHHNNWTEDEATDYIEIQVQQQMECTGIKRAHVAPLIGGNRLKPLIKEYDPEFGAILRDKTDQFWRMPEPAPEAEDLRAIRGLKGLEDGSQEYRDDLAELFEEFALAKAFLAANTKGTKDAKAAAEALEAQIVQAIGAASWVKGGRYVYERKLVNRKGYTVGDTSYESTKLKEIE